METTEQQFRQAEALLTAALAAASPALAARGIGTREHVAPNYHYKQDYLRWEAAFSREWTVGLKTAEVRIECALAEPARVDDALLVEVSLRAQLYRSGQASTVDVRSNAVMTVAELLEQGIASVVLERMKEGAAYIKVD